MTTVKPALAVFFVLLTLTGCPKSAPAGGVAGKSHEPAVSTLSGASISIASITPDPSQPLRAGDKVKLKIEADFSLPSGEGMVGVVVHGPDNKPIESNLKPVTGRGGKHVTEIDFVVPSTTPVSVQVPLYVKGENKSVQVAMKQYQVAAK